MLPLEQYIPHTKKEPFIDVQLVVERVYLIKWTVFSPKQEVTVKTALIWQNLFPVRKKK